MTGPDPTQESRWRPLFGLLRRMDAEIEQVYAESGYPDFRASFTLPLVRLSRRGPMSVRALAEECAVSHSAASQKVAALKRAGLVTSEADPTDRRARLVTLTPLAARAVALGEAEWAATEAALAELEDELPYALSRAVADVEAALASRSFGQRLRDHLAQA